MSDDVKITRLEKRFMRERVARKEAEQLLEEKSLALYESNLELKALADNLEKIVAQRTSELEKEKDRALDLSMAKSRFVATMSHEIRTPINGVTGALNLLADEPLNDASRNLLDIAQHSSEVLLHVINDILDFSKIEAGQMSIESFAFDLKSQMVSIIDHFKLAINSRPVHLQLNYAPEVSDYIVGDSHRLTQVMNNFLSNAIKFTEQGEVKMNISLNIRGFLKFEVIDSGIGISKSGQERLFKDFSQVDASTSRVYGGTGLGLVICKKIIEMMGGQVGVISQEGMGSCFWVEIPYLPAQASQIQQDKTAVFESREEDVQASILLVDDNLVNRKIGEKVLTKFGHRVTLAESGKEALFNIVESEFDLIFMDCQMPEMDGFETTRKIRDVYIDTPVIALTANTSNEDKQAAIESGMNDFVSKPFQPDKLQILIQQWLKQGR